MPVNGIELAAGQKWETISGSVAILEDNPGSGLYIFRTVYEDGEWSTVTKDGKRRNSDSDSYLKELIYDPEQQVKDELNMKFNPQPGDKIICNNGEEFICCTLEFLKETFHDLVAPSEVILGYNESWSEWQSWDFNGQAEWGGLRYHVREVIPQSSEASADKKEEVKEEPRYTVEEVTEAFSNALHLSWMGGHKEGIEKVKDYLEKKSNKEYQEYLRLKAIYE